MSEHPRGSSSDKIPNPSAELPRIENVDDLGDIAAVARTMIEGGNGHEDSQPTGDTENEIVDLQKLAERYGVAIEFIQNGDAGYVARMERVSRVGSGMTIEYHQAWEGTTSTQPIIAFDADDTQFAYTETKKPRADAFSQFAHAELGYELDADILDQLMAISDDFSRWQDAGANERMYHIRPHQWALSWATSQVRGISQESIPAKLEEIKATLGLVKAGLENGHHGDHELPFNFRNGKLVLGDFTPSPNIREVFNPVYEPKPYLDAIHDIQTMAEEGVRTVAFTYGEPGFQLEKLLRLRDQLVRSQDGWPYDYVLLTTKPKGTFIEELLETSTHEPQLREDFFGTDPHVFMLVDDDRKQTDDFLRAQHTVENRSGAHLTAVHSLREHTKGWERRDAAYRDVPDMGRVVDENGRQGVHINGKIEDMSSGMSVYVQRAHQEAFSNLRLRIYNQLAHNLNKMVRGRTPTEQGQVLVPQQNYFSKIVYDIERAIESRHGIPFMTL